MALPFILKTLKRIHRFCTTNYTYLLLNLVLLFVTRPFNTGVEYFQVWKLFFALAFLGVIFNVRHPFIIRVIAISIAIPAIGLGWVGLYYPNSFFIVSSFVLIQVFMFMCVFSLIYYGVLRAPPSFGGVYPMICAYFMVGYAFSYTYMLIEYLLPGSFNITDFTYNPAVLFQIQYLDQMIYYSLGTLMIVGVSDIVATGYMAHTVFILNSMVGQFYIAILVARLISLSSFLQHKKLLEKQAAENK